MITENKCQCKKFSGYTVGYFCRSCKKPIYTPEQAEEVDQLRERQVLFGYIEKQALAKEYLNRFGIDNGRDQEIIKFYEKTISSLLHSQSEQMVREVEEKDYTIAQVKSLARKRGKQIYQLQKQLEERNQELSDVLSSLKKGKE